MNWEPSNIASLRKRLHYSQDNFGKLLGVSRVHIYLLEKGTNRPSQTLQNLLSYIEKDKTLGGNQMTISDKIALVVKGTKGNVLDKQGLFHLLEKPFPGITEKQWASILLTDYCYNRTNKDAKKRKFFEYLETNTFKVWGEHADYDGEIIWQEKGFEEKVVGKCKNGVQYIEDKYLKLIKGK